MRMLACSLWSVALLGCGASVTARVQGWNRARTAHVTLATDAGAERAEEVAQDVEQLHHALSHVFFSCGVADGTAIDVVLLEDAREYDRVGGANTVGMFREGASSWISVPDRIVLRNDRLRARWATQVILHELTHRFVAACFPQAPTWLNEGLAAVFETLEVGSDSLRVGIPAYQVSSRARGTLVDIEDVDVRLVNAHFVPPPSELVAMTATDFYGDLDDRSASRELSGHYAGAWALVHLLEFGGNEALTASFHGYLAGLMEADRDPDALFAQELAAQPLDSLFSEYLARERYTAYRLGLPAPLSPSSEVVPMTAGDALRLLAELYCADGEEALRPIIDAAATLAPEAAWPHLLAASIAATDTQRRAALDAAITRAPDDIEVLRAEAYELMSAEEIDEARLTTLSRALMAEPVPTSGGRIALSEMLRNLGHPAAALRYATDAVRLDPTSWQAHFQLAVTLLDTDRLDAAARSFRTVLSLTAHHPDVAARTAALLSDTVRRREATRP